MKTLSFHNNVPGGCPTNCEASFSALAVINFACRTKHFLAFEHKIFKEISVDDIVLREFNKQKELKVEIILKCSNQPEIKYFFKLSNGSSVFLLKFLDFFFRAYSACFIIRQDTGLSYSLIIMTHYC